MNAHHKKYADRLTELLTEGRALQLLAKPTLKNPELKTIQDQERLQAWISSVQNLVVGLFGEQRAQFKDFAQLKTKKTYYPSTIKEICGFLSGVEDDLKKGILHGFEFIVAGELFENVLEQADHLCDVGHKDAAAVLARAVLENTLKKMAQRAGLSIRRKMAAELNDDLKIARAIDAARNLEIKGWLNIGNTSAHGDFTTYDAPRVKTAIQHIKIFIQTEFGV
jgi:hypothetical protein